MKRAALQFLSKWLTEFSNNYTQIMSKIGPLFPVGLYLVDEQGHFKYCNDACREILGISAEQDVSQKSIKEYYVNPNLRIELIKKLEQNNGVLKGQIIEFKRENSEGIIFVEDNCKRFKLPSKPDTYLYIGSIKDITEIVRYRQLFGDLTAGVFRMNRNN